MERKPNLDNDLLQSIAKKKETKPKAVVQEKTEGVIAPSDEKFEQLNIKIPSGLKKKLKVYCVNHDLDQKEFIATLISKAIL